MSAYLAISVLWGEYPIGYQESRESRSLMCRRVSCKVCGKPTWAGCGNHVEQALAGVPKKDRCPGHTDAERAEAAGPSLLSRMFARR